MFNVVYSPKDQIAAKIADGTIPAESLIITNDNSNELYYYDHLGETRQLIKKTQFKSKTEALRHIAADPANYIGSLVSILVNDEYAPYMVAATQELMAIPYAKDVLLAEDTLIVDGNSWESEE